MNAEMTQQESEPKIELLVDSVSYKNRSKPTDPEYAGIRKRLAEPSARRQVSKEELVGLIKNGYTFMPAVCVGGTKTENWTRQQLFVLDFDNDDAMKQRGYQVLDPDDALVRAYDEGLNPWVLYFTHSATVDPWNPRYRILFALDEAADSPEEAKQILSYLHSVFPEADPSSKQLVHMYLCPGKEVWPCL